MINAFYFVKINTEYIKKKKTLINSQLTRNALEMLSIFCVRRKTMEDSGDTTLTL